jgi:ABC-2 type transport system permease protein
MIYVVVFLFFAVFLANTYKNPANASFTDTKVNIAFINHDTNSKIVEGLKDYLSKKANIVNISDDTQKLQDALFFREAEYIVKVPKGFAEDFVSGKAVQLEKTAVPASASEIYIDNIINKYLNTAKVYINNGGSLSEVQLLSYVDNDLSQKTEVKVNNSLKEVSKNEKASYYFNYLAYSLFAVLILGVSSVMMVFNKKDLKNRNFCSPIKLSSMNFQMILGNLSYAVLAWFAMVIASFFMYGSYMFTSRGLLFLLNSLVFTFAALSISFLIGNVIKGPGAMSAAANVVSLGTCFISGVFVPQALLGKTVLKIASFTPNYWYVKSNNSIAKLVNLNSESLAPVFLNMLIVIGFAADVLAMTLVIIKQKRIAD